MTREIYEAMRRRIVPITRQKDPQRYEELLQDYKEREWSVPAGAVFYFFNAEGLCYVDSIIQPCNPRATIWNVCKHFYSFLRYYPDIDQKLLNSK